jgi:AcrR family transcriptional regulator
MGSLAETHVGKPGLPRGRSSLPTEVVRDEQRIRLLRAALSTSAELGYDRLTITEVARRARVSLNVFYELFSDKADCFVTALAVFGAMMWDHCTEAAADAPPEDRLRASLRAYLRFLAREPELARCYHFELRAAGAAGRELYFEVLEQAARRTQLWHRRAYGATLPDDIYIALAGAVEQLVAARVASERVDALPELEDTLMQLHDALLGRSPVCA